MCIGKPMTETQTKTEQKSKIREKFLLGGEMWVFIGEKKTARTSQKEEEVGELPRATEVTGGRRSFQKITAINETTGQRSYSHVITK